IALRRSPSTAQSGTPACCVETIYQVAAKSMRSWVSTRRRHSRSRLSSDLPDSALPSRRLCREKALSMCQPRCLRRWGWGGRPTGDRTDRSFPPRPRLRLLHSGQAGLGPPCPREFVDFTQPTQLIATPPDHMIPALAPPQVQPPDPQPPPDRVPA